jgi:hypothetical protein
VFGVISMTLGHIFMICACAVGVLIIWTELIPAKPARHKLAFTVALIGIMFIADYAIVAIRRGENPLGRQGIGGAVLMGDGLIRLLEPSTHLHSFLLCYLSRHWGKL